MQDSESRLKVLFLCTGNSCRSQMAEAWTRHIHPAAIEPHSAGVAPHGIDPRAVEVMAEAGIDLSMQAPTHVDDVMHIPFDFVITVCDHAHETCPLFPGKTTVVHVGFDDPPRLAQDAGSEEEALRHYRRVRDEIRAFVEELPENLSLREEKR